MKNTLLTLFSLFALTICAQNIERVTIDGKIVVASKDKEGVTVFNSSSNKGSITDKDGNFKIEVTINDTIEFGALQFQDFKVVVSQQIIETKKMTVILFEEINKLDEVVLLPFGLTGNLNADLNNVRTYNVDLDAIYFGLDHISDFEFSADYKTNADNLAFNEANPHVGNMLDIVNIAGFLLDVIITDTKKSKDKTKKEKAIKFTPFRKALDQYSFNYLHTNFNIPLHQVEAFVLYVDQQNIDETLFESNNELLLLDRITTLSKLFLKKISEKK